MSDLYQLAQDAIQRTNDIDEAASDVMQRIKATKGEAYRGLVSEAIRRAAFEAVYDARHSMRDTVRRDPGTTGRGANAVAAANQAITESLLDGWTLPDGTVLGDATGHQLQHHSERESALAAGHLKNSAFFNQLASVCGNRRVRRVCSEAKVRKLWQNVANSMDQPASGA